LATVSTLPFTPEDSTDTYWFLPGLAQASGSGDITTVESTDATDYFDSLIATITGLIGTPSDLGGGATVAANLSDIEGQTDDIGAAGVGLTEAGGDGDHLTAIDLPNQTMDITGSITGNLSGSVGSVTGAVGSVTGNVGGNVTGSVGSVTGAVGSVTGNVGGNVTGSVGSVTGGINTSGGTITTLDGLDTAQDAQHAVTQAAIVPLTPVSGTIGAVGNDTTHLHLTGLPYGDDEINNQLILIFDNSGSEYHWRYITDWADTGDLATVSTLPFTPEDSTDTYWFLPGLAQASGSGDITTVESTDATDYFDSLIATITGLIGTPSDLGGGATVAANLSDIEGQTDDIGAAGAGLTEAGGDGDHLTAVTATADVGAIADEVVTHMDANSSDFTTILARLGAFTGSGDNTILGFFKALFRSDANTPSDMGGTADSSTDSLQAIRDRGDAAWTGSVTGTGDTAVNADTLDDEGSNMYYKTGGGDGIGGAIVRAFVASEYASSGTAATLRGTTTTADDGSWVDDLQLNAGTTYTIWFWKQGAYGPDTTEVTP
jgi:hypothetical protein